MSVSPERPEDQRKIQRNHSTADWIGDVAQVLGAPEYWTTPEEDSDGLQEIATYYLPSIGEEDAVYPDISGTVLTIIRNLTDDVPYFTVDVRTFKKGERERGFEFSHISAIEMDPTTKMVHFSGVSTEGVSLGRLVGVSVSGEVVTF